MGRTQPLLSRMSHLKRGGRGFTLIEAIISLTILAVVMTAFYKLMFDQSLTFVEESREIDAQTNTRRTSDLLLNELQDAQPIDFDTTNGLWFKYALPHKNPSGQMLAIPTDDSQPFGAQNGTTWVKYDPTTAPNATYTVLFVPGTRPNDTVTFLTQTFRFGVFRITNNLTGEFRELGRVALRNPGGVFFWPLINQAADSSFRSFTYYGVTNSSVPTANTGDLPYLWPGNELVTYGAGHLPANDVVFNDPINEDYVDANSNGRWDAMLFCQFYYMDMRGNAANTGDMRDSLSRVNLVRVPIAFRNVPRRRGT